MVLSCKRKNLSLSNSSIKRNTHDSIHFVILISESEWFIHEMSSKVLLNTLMDDSKLNKIKSKEF